MFTTSNGRNAFDVAYRQLSATGDTLNLNWITAYPAGTFAIYPKIVKYGANVLLLWEEVVGTANNGIQLAILGPTGTVVTPKFPLPDKTIRLSPYYDVVALPNGKILWANQKGNDSVSVFRLIAANTPTFPGRRAAAGASLRMEQSGDHLVLTTYKEGRVTLRQFDSRGELLFEESPFFVAGSHSIPMRTAGVSYVEAVSGKESRRIPVFP